MSDITKVYIVTAGSYSDYHICAVFGTRKEAKAYCKFRDDVGGIFTGDHHIEEYCVGTFDAQKPGYLYDVSICKCYRPTATLYALCERDTLLARCDSCKQRGGSRCNIIDCYSHPGRTVELREKDPQKAIKIVQDRIAKAKAEREGL